MYIFSEYAVVYWKATSTGTSPSFSIYIGFGWIFSLFCTKYSTKEFNPPSKWNSAFLIFSSSLKSEILIFNPLVKKAISLNLFSSVS